MINFSQYSPRQISFYDLHKYNDWEFKMYWISYEDNAPNTSYIDTATRIMEERTNDLSPELEYYHTGFCIVHECKDTIYVVTSIWAGENMLDHKVFAIDKAEPSAYQRLKPETIIACVWEMEVINFERVEWIGDVLKNHDLATYRKKKLNTRI